MSPRYLTGKGWFNSPDAADALPTIAASYCPASASTAIEKLRVGDRVMGQRSAGELAGDTQVDPATWRKLRLVAETQWPDGTVDDIHVETLQSPEWLAGHAAQVGSSVPIPLDLAEMGLPADLPAKVLANDPCPPLQPGPGRVVLTTVNHLNRDVYELTVASPTGTAETIRPTGFHKFYRPADDAWVIAKELEPGDELAGPTTPLYVRTLQKLPGSQRVYNLTVEGEHVYRVSILGVLVHNSCPWEVGRANELRANSVGDSLDVRHAVQAHPAEQIIAGYDCATGPAIAVPDHLHSQISKLSGVYNGNAVDLLSEREKGTGTNSPELKEVSTTSVS